MGHRMPSEDFRNGPVRWEQRRGRVQLRFYKRLPLALWLLSGGKSLGSRREARRLLGSDDGVGARDGRGADGQLVGSSGCSGRWTNRTG